MLKMKLILSLVAFCLALNNGMGAPTKARYKFVKCNGEDKKCVTYQSPEMSWNPDLPQKLPASATQYLNAEPVTEGESPNSEEEKGESPMTTSVFLSEEGSGFEGSAGEGPYIADNAYVNENGSGESWTEADYYEGERGESKGFDWLLSHRTQTDETKPPEKELREDHLLYP